MAAAPHQSLSSGLEDKSPRFAAAWTAAFLLLGLAKALSHEPWRDEAGLWLNATGNGSLSDLFANIRYGGHPYFWITLAWFAARLSPGFFTLQAMTLAAAAMGIYALLRFSPFSKAQSLLLAFGYYFAFEYSVVNRPYVLLLLLVPLLCLCAQKSSPFASGLCAALLAQSSIYGTILALAFALGFFRRFPSPRSRILFCSLVALGAAMAVCQAIPPPDSGFATATYVTIDRQRLYDTLFGVWRGLFPVPNAHFRSWSTNILDAFPATHLWAGLAALAFMMIILRGSARPTRMFAILATAGLLAFSYIKFQGTLRHNGHYFMVVLIALWLIKAQGKRLSSMQASLIRGILWLQFGCALYASASDILFPFSASREAARIIRESGESNRLLVGERSFAAAPVTLYLNQPLFYPDANRYGTFIRWDNRREILSDTVLMERVGAEMKRTGKSALLILNREINGHGFHLLARTAESLAPDESYYLYLSDEGP